MSGSVNGHRAACLQHLRERREERCREVDKLPPASGGARFDDPQGKESDDGYWKRCLPSECEDELSRAERTGNHSSRCTFPPLSSVPNTHRARRSPLYSSPSSLLPPPTPSLLSHGLQYLPLGLCPLTLGLQSITRQRLSRSPRETVQPGCFYPRYFCSITRWRRPFQDHQFTSSCPAASAERRQ